MRFYISIIHIQNTQINFFNRNYVFKNENKFYLTLDKVLGLFFYNILNVSSLYYLYYD